MDTDPIQEFLDGMKNRSELPGREEVAEELEKAEKHIEELLVNARDKSENLPEDAEIDYINKAADMCAHRYLHAISPDGHTQRLVDSLMATAKSEEKTYKMRHRAIEMLQLLSAEIQETRLQTAVVILEQLQFFLSWYQNMVEREESHVGA